MKKRVLAAQQIDEGILYLYGEGEYLGDLVPNISPFKEHGKTNPCIKLDNGQYVWGFQCWWGDHDKFYNTYKIKETINVELEKEILPVFKPEKT